MAKLIRKKCKYLLTLFFVLVFSQNSLAEKPNIQEVDIFADTDTNIFDENNNKIYLDQFEDQTILLVFWASWCGSCVDEMPELDNLQKDFRKLPFKIIAVSEDYQGMEPVHRYFEENEIRHLEKYYDHQNALFRAYGIAGLPTAYLIAADGKIKRVFKGKIKWHDDDIRAIILSVMGPQHEMPKNTYKAPSLARPIGKKTIEEKKAQEKTEVKDDSDKKEQSK